jgi:S1-C subfamily serine protease
MCAVVEGPDGTEGDDEFSDYLPPEERWWRHPSELHGAGPEPVSRPALLAPATSPRTALVLAAVIGTAGAVLAAYIAHLAHPATDDAATRSAVRLASTTTSVVAPTSTAPSSSAVPGVVRLVVPSPSGRRSGSAAAVGADRLVTSARTVTGVTQVTAVMNDGSEQSAKVLWIDHASGMAVLDIDQPTPTLASGQAANLAAGDHVTVAGTDTTGEVEAVGVEAQAEDGTRMTHLLRLRMDGPLSEGAVVLDDDGRAIGICIGHDTDETTMLAAPIELARAANGAAGDGGAQHFAWLGLTGRTAQVDLPGTTTPVATTTTAASTVPAVPSSFDAAAAATSTTVPETSTPDGSVGTQEDPPSTTTTAPPTSATAAPAGTDGTAPPTSVTGALVVTVQPGGPAANAGLVPGDVVISADGVPVSSMNALVLLVRERTAGGIVHLTVIHAGQMVERDAVLQTQPGS